MKKTVSEVGNVAVHDFAFMDGAKAKQTLVFEICPKAIEKSCSIYVDVDADGKAVAMSFVHQKDAFEIN